jgi:Divergent InlB B-repeat domain
MNRKWFSLVALVVAVALLLVFSSCGHGQELVSITVQPTSETFGASNIPVRDNAGSSVQLRALGSYIHPPVTKDITNKVTWAANDAQMFSVSSTGLLTATGFACGGSLVSATVTTNSSAGGLSSSGAIVTGSMTANVVCFTSTGSGGGAPILTVSFPGNGSGTVTSSPVGLNCASNVGPCNASFASGTAVTLTATPVGASSFGGWSGGCTNSASVCTFSLQSDTAVIATFN